MGARCVAVPGDSLVEARKKMAFVLRAGYGLAWATNNLTNPGRDALTWPEITPYLYGSDGSLRRYRHWVIKNTSWGDSDLTPPVVSQGTSLWENLWGGRDSGAPDPIGGSAYYTTNIHSSVSITASDTDFYAVLVSTAVYSGITYTNQIEWTASAGELLSDTIGRAQALYGSMTDLSLSGGIWTYSTIGAIISYSDPGLTGLGHSGSGYRGMSGYLDGSGVGGGDTIAFTGSLYVVSAATWYLTSQDFDLTNTVSGITNFVESPFLGPFLLEDLTPFHEAMPVLGSP